MKLIMFDSNTWNYLTACKQMFNIKWNFFVWDSDIWNHLIMSKQMINMK